MQIWKGECGKQIGLRSAPTPTPTPRVSSIAVLIAQQSRMESTRSSKPYLIKPPRRIFSDGLQVGIAHRMKGYKLKSNAEE